MTSTVSPTPVAASSGGARTPLLQLFVLSAVSLYFELLIVRWTNAYVINVGFFTNFLVLASFVGLGAGYVLAKRPTSLLPAFPLLLFLYCVLVHVARPKLSVVDRSALFWGEVVRLSDDQALVVAPEVFITAAYTVVALLFVLLGHSLGRLFARLPPLQGYAANIGGSLLGIVLYTVNSFVLANPVVWFGLVLGGLAPFMWQKRGPAVLAYASSAMVLGLVYWLNIGSEWSPYYRCESKCQPDGDCWLGGNGVWGQVLWRYRPSANIYTIVHGEGGPVTGRHYSEVLVIGSGGGNDVNVALKFGADHVDAVEINPLAVEYGRRLHPDQPYASPKVTTTIDDGRAFLRRSTKKYDLIVYALPDSIGLVSSHANMRSESYLFTVEAFRSVLAHLTPDGVFAVYNNYRQFWLIDKIAGMLQEAGGQPPLVATDPNASATMITGPGLAAIQRAVPTPRPPGPPPATDDWPFLYLKGHLIPDLYLSSLAAIAFISVLMVAGFAWLADRFEREDEAEKAGGQAPARASLLHVFRIDGPMFFMGAAFMLLETKSIVTFGLLFGTTWITTAMAIGAILAMVLGAIYINARLRLKSVVPWVVLLGATLALVYFLPPERFILPNPILRYVVGAAAALSPAMFANVIFAKLLGETKETPRSLASNLMGSVVGGIAEYFSLVAGYRALLPVVALFYALAFLLVYLRARRAPAVAEEIVPAPAEERSA